jgi:hypothetical protein
MKVADFSERGEKKYVLGMILVGLKDAGELVVDGEVNRQIVIYYTMSF